MRYIWSESYTRTSSYCCGLWNLQFFSCKNKILILKNESQSSQLIQLKLFHYIKSIKKIQVFFNSQPFRAEGQEIKKENIVEKDPSNEIVNISQFHGISYCLLITYPIINLWVKVLSVFDSSLRPLLQFQAKPYVVYFQEH